MSSLHFYREVAPETVPEATRRAAQGALSFAALELELADRPRLRWFERTMLMPSVAEQFAGYGWFESDARLDGRAGRGEIWLRAGMTAARGGRGRLS